MGASGDLGVSHQNKSKAVIQRGLGLDWVTEIRFRTEGLKSDEKRHLTKIILTNWSGFSVLAFIKTVSTQEVIM